MESQKQPRPYAALGLTTLAALLRLMPHPPNFAPVGSIALFGGAKLKGWQAYLVPVLVMLITDPILSHIAGYSAFSIATPVIYFSFLINVLLGRTLLRSSGSGLRVPGVAMIGSLQFFLLTNLFEWWFGISNYSHTLNGLIVCYTEALPFFGRTLLADVFYSVALFTLYNLLTRVSTTESAVAENKA